MGLLFPSNEALLYSTQFVKFHIGANELRVCKGGFWDVCEIVFKGFEEEMGFRVLIQSKSEEGISASF